MKMLFLLLGFALAFSVAAEPKFNALDASDPLYATYQANLCAGAREAAQRFASDRWWMDHRDPKIGAMSPDKRESWVADYVITTRLRDTWQQRFDANCRK